MSDAGLEARLATELATLHTLAGAELVPWLWLLGALGLLVVTKKANGTTAPAVNALPNAPADPPVVRHKGPELRSPKRLRLEDVIRLTNEARARGVCGYPPAPPLASDAALERAAQAHAADMAAEEYFDHRGLDGRTPSDRMRAAGFGGAYVGENIAAGQLTAREVVDGWINSPGHCRNLMAKEYTRIGIGHVYAAGSPLKHYWVQNFGG